MKALAFVVLGTLAAAGASSAGPEVRQVAPPAAPTVMMAPPATLWLLPVASGKKGKKRATQFGAPFFTTPGLYGSGPLFRRIPTRYVVPLPPGGAPARAAPAPAATGVEQREAAPAAK
jgi:hypothetical protein